MSVKFLIGSLLAATVVFTGCASKDVNNTGAGANSSSAASGSNASSSSTVGASSSSALESAQAKIKTINFDYDKFNIRADMQPVAEENAKAVGKLKVKLEGNADERGSDEYNYALALKRANAVKAAYQSKGIATADITTVSLGEGNPVCKESNDACWSKNRRVDSKLEN